VRADEQPRDDRADRRDPGAHPQRVMQALDVLEVAGRVERGARRHERASAATPIAMPAWRNVSFVPAARPLCSTGAEPSATAVSAGLNRPVPTPATSRPGSSTVHEEFAPASVMSAMPAATSPSPPPIITRGEIRSPRLAVAPETRKITTVAGRYARPASIGDMPSTCCRYSVA
jgi:hypothetical protein